MVISLRKALVLVILALVLFTGLLAWSMRASALPVSPHSHLSGPVSHYCPPPPFVC